MTTRKSRPIHRAVYALLNHHRLLHSFAGVERLGEIQEKTLKRERKRADELNGVLDTGNLTPYARQIIGAEIPRALPKVGVPPKERKAAEERHAALVAALRQRR